ncbi:MULTISPECIES: helix-turn-helix domain-containing protein [Pseudomonas]|uniref:helix-turn-helix domain-containing protein n=1 Tax=Pseudomonas TaxID=286 RepID=UPI001E3CBE90|nr:MULTISPECIES: helix-turn-helix transcriptional regulator [Pseudomonas]MCE0952436.1 helix-turn-helix transcriptional regulator [Pseudomonas asiatica]
MALKTSFANVLRAIRSTRNLTQRQLGDSTSRTYLSKLEARKSSITIDKLDQLSQGLNLSPLTLLTLTVSEDTGEPAGELIARLNTEILELQRDGGLANLRIAYGALPGRLAHPSGHRLACRLK